MPETINIQCSKCNEYMMATCDNCKESEIVGQKVWAVFEVVCEKYHAGSFKRMVAIFDTKEKAEDLMKEPYPEHTSHYMQEMIIS